MSESILHIRETIALAREQERESHQLQTYLQTRLPCLHPSIALPRENAVQALLEFVQLYIEQVPDFLEALRQLLREANIEDTAESFIAIAEDFFLHPPDVIKDHCGLQALIDEAYLAHRLIEEINDRLELTCGFSLPAFDMTYSNIIVHDILGEEFANQLDLAVHYAIEALFQTDALTRRAEAARGVLATDELSAASDWLAENAFSRWRAILNCWPSLSDDNVMRLQLRQWDPQEDEPTALH